MAIDYVICAAGAGTRTKAVNQNIPKYRLRMQGKSFLERSLDSLDIFPGDQLIIVIQQAESNLSLKKSIKERYPLVSVQWVGLSELTKGQAASAFSARQFLKKDNRLVIFNVDTFFRSRTLTSLFSDENVDGIIPCSQEEEDCWSFCEVGQNNEIIRVAEKNRISEWCSVGFYYFKHAEDFFNAFQNEHGVDEQFVAPLYNQLIKAGKKVVLNSVDIFRPFGSLKQIEHYWGIPIAALKAENPLGTIVVDLDGTLTHDDLLKDYSARKPRHDVITKLQEYASQGYEIVVQTARRMKTHNGDEAKVVADIGATTLEWLRKHQVPFCRIKFAKPYAENGFYVDDRAIRPSEFLRLSFDEIVNLLKEENPD